MKWIYRNAFDALVLAMFGGIVGGFVGSLAVIAVEVTLGLSRDVFLIIMLGSTVIGGVGLSSYVMSK